MVSKVMRVMGIVLIIVAALTVVLYAAYGWIPAGSETQNIPIDKITGIYADAKLKPGCIVSGGSYFYDSDSDIRIHSDLVVVVSMDGEPVAYDVSNIKIIDVYGDKCTIIFNCENDKKWKGHSFCSNYPLDNLEYDPLSVFLANDYVETELNGTGYTLKGAPSFQPFPRAALLLIPVTVVPGVILLGISFILNKRKKHISS